jgi:hypothetical protein
MDVPRRRESELQQLFNDIVKRIDSVLPTAKTIEFP